MAVMTKRVNINAPIAIRSITPPIYGVCKNIIMSTGDILKCLCKRAIVDEILPDGSTIRLNMRNYYTDNGAGLDASVHSVIDTAEEDFVDQSVVQNEETASTTIDINAANSSKVVDDIEDATITTESDISKDSFIKESSIDDKNVSNNDTQTNGDNDEVSVSYDDSINEDAVIATTTEEVSNENKEDISIKSNEEKEAKIETVEKNTTVKSTSNIKKKNSNNSKKKTSSNK